MYLTKVLSSATSNKPTFRIWSDPDYKPPKVFRADDYFSEASIEFNNSQ